MKTRLDYSKHRMFNNRVSELIEEIQEDLENATLSLEKASFPHVYPPQVNWYVIELPNKYSFV